MTGFLFAMLVASTNASERLEVVQPTCRAEAGASCRAVSADLRNGARAQVDPLGRGVWLIDDENDEVLLVPRPAASPRCETLRTRSFAVGAWPEQLVVTPTGRVFVTVRQGGQVAVIEPDLTTWSVPLAPEPRALALDVMRGRLYVGLVTSRELVVLDANSGAVLLRRELAVSPDFLVLSNAGLVVASRRSDVVQVFDAELRLREAHVARPGVPSFLSLISIGGFDRRADLLATPFRGTQPVNLEPPRVGTNVVGLASEGSQLAVVLEESRSSGFFAGGGGYGGGPQPVRHELLLGVAEADGITLTSSRGLSTAPVREVQVHAKKTWVFFEGEDAPVGFGAAPLGETHRLFADGPIFAAAFLDGDTPVVATRQREVRWLRVLASTRESVTELPASRLDAELRRGRQLFHETSPAISFLGLSCASCHPEGREDGRVWTQGGGLRQTPLLADRLASTGPYNWLGTKQTLEDNIHQTITERLGGRGLVRQDRAALARFLLEGLKPVTTRAPAQPLQVARGAELFVDEEVGCAHCHPPERGFRDAKVHDLKFVSPEEKRVFASSGLGPRMPRRFNTPSLRHAAVTAPYLHNGEAPTLASLLETNHDRMGETSHLSPDDRAALVAYVESL